MGRLATLLATLSLAPLAASNPQLPAPAERSDAVSAGTGATAQPAPAIYAGTYSVATATWTPATWGGGNQNFLGGGVVYNNSYPTGNYYDVGGENTLIDYGRLPSTTSVGVVGSQDSYRITSFQVGYCTSALDLSMAGPGAHVEVAFLQYYGDCHTSWQSSPPVATFDLVGLPGSLDGTPTCYVLDVDLTGSEFCLRADGDGAFDNVEDQDGFGYRFRIFNEPGPAGPLLRGHETDCGYGDGTVFQNPAGCDGLGSGTGLGSQDHYRKESDGAGTFGGNCITHGAPHASLHLVLTSDLSGGCADCPVDDPFEPNDGPTTPTPVIGMMEMPGMALTSGDADWFAFEVPKAYQLTIDASFLDALGDVDLLLWDLTASSLWASSISGNDGEFILWNNPTGLDTPVLLEVSLGSGGAPSGCVDYDLFTALNVAPCPQVDDAYEPNDTCATAGPFLFPGSDDYLVTRNGAEDWYSFPLGSGRRLRAYTVGHFGTPNPFLTLYANDCNTVLETGSNQGLSRTLTYENMSLQTQDVRLHVDNAAACQFYWLNILEDAAPCFQATEDIFEENDSCATAAPLALGSTPGLLLIDADDDYFRITVPAAQILDLEALFEHDDADLDMRLYLPGCGTEVAVSESGNDDEVLEWVNETGGPVDVVLFAYVWNDVGCVGYELVASVSPDPCQTGVDDALEDDDICAFANVVGPGTLTDLWGSKTDADWFEVNVPAWNDLDMIATHETNEVRRIRLYDACGGNFLAESFTFSNAAYLDWTNTLDLDRVVFAEILVKPEAPHSCSQYDLDVYVASDDLGTSYCTSDVNSSGTAAVIGASGTANVSSNDLALFTSGMVPTNFGIFFHGPAADASPFFGHTLCVGGGPLVRSPVQQASAEGTISWVVDVPNVPEITEGTTRYFQTWYRDAGDPQGVNLSDGYAIDFF